MTPEQWEAWFAEASARGRTRAAAEVSVELGCPGEVAHGIVALVLSAWWDEMAKQEEWRNG